MIDFSYFHFAPVPFDAVSKLFGNSYSQEQIRAAHGEWAERFYTRAKTLYFSQFCRHTASIRRAFYQEHGLDTDLGLSEYPQEYADLWETFCRCEELEAHQREQQESLDISWAVMNKWTSPSPYGACMSGILIENERLLTVAPDLNAMLARIWTYWFDCETNVPPEEQTRLRRLPYAEYRKSTYWKRVRAAMCLIYRLRCQSHRCTGLDSWLLGEYDLKVHHLHYRNRGRERLDNLRLLCADCHKKAHDGNHSVEANRGLR